MGRPRVRWAPATPYPIEGVAQVGSVPLNAITVGPMASLGQLRVSLDHVLGGFEVVGRSSKSVRGATDQIRGNLDPERQVAATSQSVGRCWHRVGGIIEAGTMIHYQSPPPGVSTMVGTTRAHSYVRSWSTATRKSR